MSASSAGRAARAHGASAEALVLAQSERYRVEGRCYLERIATPARSVGGGRQVYTQGAACDFRGILAGGRGVCAEVKSSSRPSLSLYRHGEPVLSRSQAAQLSWYHALGGLAWLLVRTSAGWWRIDWSAWDEAVAEADAAGRASLGAAALDWHGHRLPLDGERPLYLDEVG